MNKKKKLCLKRNKELKVDPWVINNHLDYLRIKIVFHSFQKQAVVKNNNIIKIQKLSILIRNIR